MKRLLAGVGALVMLLLLCATVLSSYLLLRPEALGTLIEASLESALGYPVTYRAAEPRLSPSPALSLVDVRVVDPGASLELFHAGEIRLTLDLLALLDKHVHITELAIEDMVWNLAGAKDSLAPQTSQGSPPEPASIWPVTIDQFHLGSEHFDVDASLDLATDRVEATGTVTIRPSSGLVQQSVLGRLDASLVEATDGALSLDLAVEALGVSLALAGRLGHLPDLAGMDMTLDLEGVAGASLKRKLGVTLPTQPTFSAQGRLRADTKALTIAPLALALDSVTLKPRVVIPSDEPAAFTLQGTYAVADLAAIGTLFGTDPMPALAFSGDLEFDATSRALAATIENETHDLDVTGTLGDGPRLGGTEVQVKGGGARASDWLELLLEFSLEGPRPYTVAGPITWDGEEAVFGPLDAVIDDLEMDLEVWYRIAGDNWVEVDSGFTARSLENLGDMLGITDLPAWTAQGRYRYRADDELLVIEGGFPDRPETDVRLSTTINEAATEAPFSLDFDIRGPDVNALFPDAFAVPVFPYETTGNIRQAADRLNLSGVDLRFGPTVISGEGWIALGAEDRAFLDFRTSGDSLASLGTLGPMTLPNLPYTLDAQLLTDEEQVRIEHLRGSIAENDLDISGVLETGAQLALTLRGRSENLDLARLPGTDPTGAGFADTQEDVRTSDESRAKDARFFSDEPFDLAWLDAFTLDLELEVGRMIFEDFMIRDVELVAAQHAGVLQVDRFAFDDELGHFNGTAVVRHREAALDLDLELRGEDLALASLFNVKSPPGSAPRYALETNLKSTGSSFADLAARVDGDVLVHTDGGLVEKDDLDRFSGDLLTEIFSQNAAPDTDFIEFECLVLRGYLREGVFHFDPGMTMRSARSNLFVQGEANLRDERYDLTFSSQARKGIGVSAGTIFNSFFRLQGSLLEPEVNLDPGGAASTAALAALTGGLSLLIRGVEDRAASEEDACAAFLNAPPGPR